MDKIALYTGKILAKLLKLMKKNGGSLPGKKAYQIAPSLLKKFKYPKTVVLVTGTNGKTSTANMIAKILSRSGIKCDNNAKGDNIVNGILSLLIKNSDLHFNIKKEALVIEIDELTLAQRLSQIKASHIVINNFFRDQLDRAGEMENIIVKIGAALENFTGTLILNEDDPNVKRLELYAKKAKIIRFGIDKIDKENDHIEEASEGKFCPKCDSRLDYNYYQYSHLGDYYCTKCDFKRETLDYRGRDVDAIKHIMIINDIEYKFNIILPYHLYNCMATYAVINTLGIDNKNFRYVTENFSLELGRMEMIKGVLLNLVKNPTGANEVFRYIRSNDDKKNILFLLNDNIADGNDVSWIWDVEIKNINNIDTIICTGTRAYDMAIRFKYEGYKNIVIIEDVKKAVEKLYSLKGKNYAISNYTGLFMVRKVMLDVSKSIVDVQ